MSLMFEKHSVQLHKVFDYYSSGQGRGNSKAPPPNIQCCHPSAQPVDFKTHTTTLGQKLVILGTGGERRGLLKLAHDFDICPAMLTKREVKHLLNAVCRYVPITTPFCQLHSRTSVRNGPNHNNLVH